MTLTTKTIWTTKRCWWLLSCWNAVLFFFSFRSCIVHAMPSPLSQSPQYQSSSSVQDHDNNVHNNEPLGQTPKVPFAPQDNHNDMHLLFQDASTTLAGKITPVISKLYLTPKELKVIWKTISQAVHWEDLVLLAAVGWLSLPSVEGWYERILPKVLQMFSSFNRQPKQKKHEGKEEDEEDQEDEEEQFEQIRLEFRQSFLYTAVDLLQDVAKIALLIYMFDIVKMIGVGMGFQFAPLETFKNAFAQIAYTAGGAYRVQRLKKYSIRQYISKHPETWGRMQIVNRFADAAIYAGTLFIVLNILQVQMGVAMQSFLAFGSVGTLAVGLASQGIAKEVLNGLFLASSDRIYEGDSVTFGNGKSGTIVKLGWMETVLRGSDEVTVCIPNTDLVKQHISNLSRVRNCQVKQVLRIRLKEAQKIPDFLESLKSEIIRGCRPALITDGSRPFRIHWTNFGEDYLEITIDTHYAGIKPIGDEYWNNRQRVLFAIQRAIQKHQIELVERPQMVSTPSPPPPPPPALTMQQ